MDQPKAAASNDDGWVVVPLHGVLDLASTITVEKDLHAVTALSGPRIVLDLAGVDFVDTTGLGMLVRLSHRLQGLDGELRLAAPNPRLLRLLRLTGLSRMFRVFDSVIDAVSIGAGTPGRRPSDNQ